MTLLTELAALALAIIASALHCHQFGEVSRMARDAGFSAMLAGGAVIGVSAAIRTVRREIESGTAEAALALSVSRPMFFIAKTAGVLAALALFDAALAAETVVLVRGSELGAALAAETGGAVHLWGMSLAAACAPVILPLVVAAALNRFARLRFVLASSCLVPVFAVAGVCYRPDFGEIARYAPVVALFAMPAFVFAAAASSFATRLRSSAATTLAVLVILLSLPALGNYCLAESLAGGSSPSVAYALGAIAAALIALSAFLAFGANLFASAEPTARE